MKTKFSKLFDREEIILSVILVLLCSTWIGISSVFYTLCKTYINGFLANLYHIINGNIFVNLVICTIIIIVFVRWIVRIIHDNDLRYHRIFVIALAFLLLYYKNPYAYANIVWKLDYQTFLAILFGITGIITLVGFFIKSPVNDNQNDSVGFSTDAVDTFNNSLDKYAEELALRLLSTKLDEGSYAIGITGEWGAGKTHFLDTLKNKIADNAEIVVFNPWMCRNPEQVVSDFFASLRHQLSPKHTSLSRLIYNYAQVVNSLSITAVKGLSIGIKPKYKEESLFEKKKKLSDKFGHLSKPVVVVIDDIDRLERNEVFEVLRLIRNTADLNNIIYLVAYDKEYVTSILEEKQIKDATAYLEKIFPVEIHLPKVDEEQLWQTLYAELNKQSGLNIDFSKLLFDNINQDNKKLMLSILNNYRRIKRFARLYMLNLSYIQKNINKDLKYLDVLWLELLQMYDKKVYNILSNDPKRLLYLDNNRYVLKDGISTKASNDDRTTYKGNHIWKTETSHLLELLFGKYIKTKNTSISQSENYEKYFSFSVSSYRLSMKELDELFKEENDPEIVMNNWLNDGKYYSSISYQLEQYSMKNIPDRKLESYLTGVLTFGVQVLRSKARSNYFIPLLQSYHYANQQQSFANTFVKNWFNQKITEDFDPIIISSFLNKLYMTEYRDDNNKQLKSNPILLSNNEIELLLQNLMTRYLTVHPELTALSVLKEKEPFGKLFNNCCVTEIDAEAYDGCSKYKQVAFDIVINHFSQNGKLPVADYESAIGNMFYQKAPAFDDPQEESDYMDYMAETYEKQMESYFGNNYKEKLTEFRDKCYQ